MTELPREAQSYLDELRGRPGARAEATIGEIWNAEWTRSGLDTIGGVGKPFNDAYQELSDAVVGAHGADLQTLGARYGIYTGKAVTPDERVAALNALVDVLPEDQRKPLEPLRDVRRRASDKAQAIEREASDVSSATYGLTGVGTAFAAGVARQTVDPVNLAAMAATAPIGGPLAGPVLKVVGRQALAGGLAQAAVEPFVQPQRAELGLESGFKEGVINVGQAAIGGGALAGLFRGGAAAVRAVGRIGNAGEFTVPGPRRVDAAAPAEGRPVAAEPEFAAVEKSARPAAPASEIERVFQALDPAELDAAALHAETRHIVDGARLPDADPVLHSASIEEAARSMDAGRPFDAEQPRAALRDAGVEAPPLDADHRAKYSTRGGTRHGLRSEAMEVYREQVRAKPDEPALSDLPLPDDVKAKAPPEPAATSATPAGGAAAAPKPLGNPALAADAERVLAEAPDLDVVLVDAEGNGRKVKARDALKSADDDAAAVRELMGCIGTPPAAA
jgi:hypothetical protein